MPTEDDKPDPATWERYEALRDALSAATDQAIRDVLDKSQPVEKFAASARVEDEARAALDAFVRGLLTRATRGEGGRGVMVSLDLAKREAETVGRLIAHILANHVDDDDAKDTTLALLLEHLHHQRQCGIRESADLVRQLEQGMRGDRQRTLGIVANALTELAARNDARRRAR